MTPRPLNTLAAWSWRLLVIAGALTLVVVVLIKLYVVVVPVLLALFLASVLEPAVGWLRRHRWPSLLAALTVFLAMLGSLVLVVGWIASTTAEQFKDLGTTVDQGVEQLKIWLQGEPFRMSPARVEELQRSVQDALAPTGGGVTRGVLTGARAAGEVAGGLVLLVFTLFFVLKDGASMADWFRQRLPEDYRDEIVELTRRFRSVMRQYLVATAITGLIDAVLIGVTLAVLNVPVVIPLAVLTFLGGFVPIVGATAAGFVAALVALVAGGFDSALLVVAATIAVQQIEGNLLQPLILERAVRLHPLVTVWAVGAGIILGGLLGAFIAVPLVAAAVATGSYYRNRHRPEAEPFDPEVEPPPEVEPGPSAEAAPEPPPATEPEPARDAPSPSGDSEASQPAPAEGHAPEPERSEVASSDSRPSGPSTPKAEPGVGDPGAS